MDRPLVQVLEGGGHENVSMVEQETAVLAELAAVERRLALTLPSHSLIRAHLLRAATGHSLARSQALGLDLRLAQ